MLQLKIESNDQKEIQAFLKGIGLLFDLEDITDVFPNRPGGQSNYAFRVHCRAHLNTHLYLITAQNEAGEQVYKKRVRLKKPDASDED